MQQQPEEETAHPVAAGVSRESHRTLTRNETMRKTVQQSATESIGQSPASRSEKSDAPRNWQVWSDQDWLESGAPPSIHNRLSGIDRALQGIRAIHDLLALNFERNTFIRNHGIDEAACCALFGLTDTHEEGLFVAMRVLLDTTESPLRELRNNHEFCWGNKGGGK